MRGPGRVIRFPGPSPDAPPPGGRSAVEVHRCGQPEAVVVRGLLESAGIPTMAESRLAQSVHPFTVGDQGTVAILVPAADAGRAQRLLRRLAR